MSAAGHPGCGHGADVHNYFGCLIPGCGCLAAGILVADPVWRRVRDARNIADIEPEPWTRSPAERAEWLESQAFYVIEGAQSWHEVEMERAGKCDSCAHGDRRCEAARGGWIVGDGPESVTVSPQWMIRVGQARLTRAA